MSLSIGARAAVPHTPDAQSVREGVLRIPGVFPLHHGGELRDARLAWRLAGASGAPVVCALGGISANQTRTCQAGNGIGIKVGLRLASCATALSNSS